jgi:hypothetical protein
VQVARCLTGNNVISHGQDKILSKKTTPANRKGSQQNPAGGEQVILPDKYKKNTRFGKILRLSNGESTSLK